MSKIKIIAPPDTKDALKRFLGRKGYEFTEDEKAAEEIVLDATFGDAYDREAGFPYPGLQHFYRFVTQDKILPVFVFGTDDFASTDVADNREFINNIVGYKKGKDKDIVEKDFFTSVRELTQLSEYNITNPTFLHNLLKWLSSLTPCPNLYDRNALETLRSILRKISTNQYHQGRLELKKTQRLSKQLKWNVLVVDNDILEGNDALSSLERILGFPTEEFWRKINAVPYFPKHLTNKELDLNAFLTDLRYEIYKHDIDLILLDISLSYGVKNNEKRLAFNFLDLIEQQFTLLGWQSIPIITFTAYDKESAAVFESIERGSKWFCSKDENSSSWVGNLPEILEEMYGLEVSKREYLEKYLPTCSGQTRQILEDFLNNEISSDTISLADFDLQDSFFRDEKEKKSIDLLAAACSDENGLNCDLNKFWEYHYVFRRLFTGFDEVKILQKNTSGFSGTDVFFVMPYADGIEHSVHIVKLGARDIIEQEYTNFEEWINGMLDSFIGRIKGQPIKADLYAGLLYVSIGIKDDYLDGNKPLSLKELIEYSLENKTFRNKKVEWGDVTRFIEFLFSNVLISFYKQEFADNGKAFAKLISVYLEDLPSMVSGTFLDENEKYPIDKFEIVKLERLENLFPETQSFKKSKNEKPGDKKQTIYQLQNFEIFEVDRIGKKLKLINRHFYLPKNESQNYPFSIKDKNRYLKELNYKVDLRVDVSVFGKEGEELLRDPRIKRGKRLSLKIKHARFAWNDTKLRFLDIPNNKQKLFTACRNFLSSTYSFEFMPSEFLFHQNKIQNEYWLLNQLWKLAENGILTTPKELTFSHTHGDLNLENVQLTQSGNELLGWFIDFAKARYGHAVFDFVKLETEIKTQIVAPYLHRLISKLNLIGVSLEKAVEVCLKWFLKFEQTGQITYDLKEFLPDVDPVIYAELLEKLKKLFGLIALIRRLAGRNQFGVEYNWGLLFYSVSVMKFKNLDEPKEAPLPKTLAYLAGCCAYKKLIESDSYLISDKHFQNIFQPALNKLENGYLNDEEAEKIMKVFYEDSGNGELMQAVLDKIGSRPLPKKYDDRENETPEWTELVKETAALTKAICNIGGRDFYDWKLAGYDAVDCPSTGGSGNKLPIIVPPIVIAVAAKESKKKIVIPKMSSRGIPGGTIDILESVGYKPNVSSERYIEIIEECGFSNIAPTHEFAPVDEPLMKLRRKINLMRHPEFVVASILGKKLATNCKKLVIEVKSGVESKMRFPGFSLQEATELGSQLFLDVGEILDMEIVCIITDGDRPQGKFIGNYLALLEVAAILDNDVKKDILEKIESTNFFDKKLIEQSKQFSLEMLELVGIKGDLTHKIDEVLKDGTAWNYFLKQMKEHGVKESKLKEMQKETQIIYLNELQKAIQKIEKQSETNQGEKQQKELVAELRNEIQRMQKVTPESKKPEIQKNKSKDNEVFATRSGFVTQIDVQKIDDCAKVLIANDSKIVDYKAGILLHKQIGEKVEEGKSLAMVYCTDKRYLEQAKEMIREAFIIEDESKPYQSYLMSRFCEKGFSYWDGKQWKIRKRD